MPQEDKDTAPLSGRAIIYRDGLPAALGVVESADGEGAFLRVTGHPVGTDAAVDIELCDRSGPGRWLKGVVVEENDRGIDVRFALAGSATPVPEARPSWSAAAR